MTEELSQLKDRIRDAEKELKEHKVKMRKFDEKGPPGPTTLEDVPSWAHDAFRLMGDENEILTSLVKTLVNYVNTLQDKVEALEKREVAKGT